MSGVVEDEENRRALGDLNSYLRQLVDNEDIMGDAAGITKQVIGEGLETLSQKQKYVFDNEVAKPFLDLTCERCGDRISYDQAYEALHGSQLCASCQFDQDKYFGKD